jgi:transposase
MIVPPSGMRVWLATGVTDMRRGMNGLALQVQQALDATRMAAISTCSADAAAIC